MMEDYCWNSTQKKSRKRSFAKFNRDVHIIILLFKQLSKVSFNRAFQCCFVAKNVKQQWLQQNKILFICHLQYRKIQHKCLFGVLLVLPCLWRGGTSILVEKAYSVFIFCFGKYCRQVFLLSLILFLNLLRFKVKCDRILFIIRKSEWWTLLRKYTMEVNIPNRLQIFGFCFILFIEQMGYKAFL